jgi:hypothetical protein
LRKSAKRFSARDPRHLSISARVRALFNKALRAAGGRIKEIQFS